MSTFALWVSLMTLVGILSGRIYTLCWKDQPPAGRAADVLLMGLYGVAAYGITRLLFP